MLPRRGVLRHDTTAAGTSALESWGARLARLRDIALVGFGLIYAFGYIARALHAWDNNLGVLPGGEFQYFVAGLLLLVPPALVVVALVGVWRAMKVTVQWESENAQRRKGIDTFLGTLLIAGVAILLVGDIDWLKVRAPHATLIGAALMLGAFVVNIGLAMARPESAKTPAADAAPATGWLATVGRLFDLVGRFSGAVVVIYSGFLVVLLVFVAMLLGAAKLLPVLPQALGGAAPRCAQFDVDKTVLSPELAAVLFDHGSASEAAASTRTTRTRPVLVYYSGSDTTLFKLPEAALGGNPTYELKRAAIVSILWCRDVEEGTQRGG